MCLYTSVAVVSNDGQRASGKVGTNGRGSTSQSQQAASVRSVVVRRPKTYQSHKIERVSRETKTHTGPVGRHAAESSRPLTGDDTRSVRHPIRSACHFAIASDRSTWMEIPTKQPCPPRSCTAADRKICQLRFGFKFVERGRPFFYMDSHWVLQLAAHFGSSNGSK